MQQLSGTDSTFLYAEHGNMYNHVASLAIYDGSSQVRFKDVLAHFEDRLRVHPAFNRRLVDVPLGLDRPYWIEEPNIDVEFHIRHIALPDPGDWRQLMIQVARLHSRPLDRSRPLWEIYVIDGLDNIPGLPKACFALFCKFHHAVVDGMAALHLLASLHSTHVELEEAPKGPLIRLLDRPPSGISLMARALSNSSKRALTIAKLSRETITRASKQLLAGEIDWSSSDLMQMAQRPPETRFSKKISAHRAVEGLGLSMALIKKLRSKLPGVTINDVFLALVGGTMRKYLESKDELPADTLKALMPVSLRASGAAGGNDVTGVPVPIASDIEDPLERLQAVHDGAIKSMEQAEVLGLDLLKQILDVTPTMLTDALLTRVMLPQLNTAVSNVRGPNVPLYLAGAELLRLYPVSIPADHAGINHTAVSYGGYFWIGVVSCRDMLPDPAFYMQCMRDSWIEMLAAVGLSQPDDPVFTNAVKKRKKKPARKKKA